MECVELQPEIHVPSQRIKDLSMQRKIAVISQSRLPSLSPLPSLSRLTQLMLFGCANICEQLFSRKKRMQNTNPIKNV